MKKDLIKFESRQETFEAIDKLYAAYLKSFGRKTSVDLFYGEYWAPQARSPEYKYIVAYYEPKNETEIEWFVNYISNNTL